MSGTDTRTRGKEWSNQYTTDFNQVLAERNILVEVRIVS